MPRRLLRCLLKATGIAGDDYIERRRTCHQSSPLFLLMRLVLPEQVVEFPSRPDEQRVMGADPELTLQDVELEALALRQVGRLVAASWRFSNRPLSCATLSLSAFHASVMNFFAAGASPCGASITSRHSARALTD